MPNWCHNSMEITGSSDEIARFKRTCIRVVFADEQAQLDFDAIVPMPDFPADDDEVMRFDDHNNPKFSASFEWVCAHWGTNRNACYFQVKRDEPTQKSRRRRR
jgi:hypothetical protein